MMLDYNSLLLALGFSAVCLTLTLFGTWFSRRADSFLLTLVIGLCLIIASIFSYSFYNTAASALLAAVVYFFLMAGFVAVYGAAHQFRSGRAPWNRAVWITLLSLLPGVPLMLTGYDGLGFITMNIFAALLLCETARQYWLGRAEAPGPLLGMAALYGATGVSFVLCALVLIWNRQWVLGHAPSNWAENVNIAMCIAGMTGIGALSLALHQWRLASRHRHEAMTDALTGLLNRRALFEAHGSRSLGISTAVIVFDIDRFKSINDRFGHATGDIVIRAFAEELQSGSGGQEAVARLGGEEFAVILDNVMPGRAERIAMSIARGFAEREFVAGDATFNGTVSAGIAFGAAKGLAFEHVLNLADEALYEAKRAGRNRIEVAGYLRPVSDDGERTSA
jgi:diguanylate cyclase (GGDEF)-like protein